MLPSIHLSPTVTPLRTLARTFVNTELSDSQRRFTIPEGIIVYHTAAKTMFKKTFEKDNAGKEAA